MRHLKNRRGSMVVMVAVLLVALMAAGAIAADIGRFYVVTGELQTATDAAALAGAQTLQVTGGTTPEPAVDAAVVAFVAANNKADNRSLAVDPAQVRMAFWAPGATAPDYVLNGRRPNAVSVTLGVEAKGVFGQLAGMTGLIMSRLSTAWVGNLGSNCVRPWSLPYPALYKAVSGSAVAANVAPDLDPAQFATYEQRDSSQRYFTVLGANQSSGLSNDGKWTPYNFTGDNGKKDFEDGIAGCFNQLAVGDASNGKTLPGNSNNYVNWSSEAIVLSGGQGICAFKSSSNAGCYASAGASVPGVAINVTWGDVVGNGANSVQFRYVGQFVLKCYYRATSNVCPTPEPGSPNTGYPQGTLVGYMQGLKSRILTPEDLPTIGNTPSNLQRLFLVN